MTNHRKTGDYSLVLKPTAKVPAVSLEDDVKSLEDFTKQLVDFVRSQGPTADVENASLSRSNQVLKRRFTLSLGLASALLALVGMLANYIKGFADSDDAAKRVESRLAELDTQIQERLARPVEAAPSVKDGDLHKVRTLTIAVSKLQIEQQSYFLAVMTAVAARKHPPAKPLALERAEDAVRKASEPDDDR